MSQLSSIVGTVVLLTYSTMILYILTFCNFVSILILYSCCFYVWILLPSKYAKIPFNVSTIQCHWRWKDNTLFFLFASLCSSDDLGVSIIVMTSEIHFCRLGTKVFYVLITVRLFFLDRTYDLLIL